MKKTGVASGSSPLLRYGVLAIVVILWYSFVWDAVSAKNSMLQEQIEARDAKIKRLQTKIKKFSGIDARVKSA